MIGRVNKGRRQMIRAFITTVALLSSVAASSVVAPTASAEYEFEISRFGGALVDNEGRQVTQAGSHPNLTNELRISENGEGVPAASLKDATVELPTGLIFDPSSVDSCSQADLAGAGTEGFRAICSGSAQVGTVKVRFYQAGLPFEESVPVYNIKTAADELPRFGANIATVIINFKAEVRTGGNYGITSKVVGAGQTILIGGTTVNLWGVPADAIHDSQRTCLVAGEPVEGCASAKPRLPLVSYPSDCGVSLLNTVAFVNSWENPSEIKTASFDHDL